MSAVIHSRPICRLPLFWICFLCYSLVFFFPSLHEKSLCNSHDLSPSALGSFVLPIFLPLFLFHLVYSMASGAGSQMMRPKSRASLVACGHCHRVFSGRCFVALAHEPRQIRCSNFFLLLRLLLFLLSHVRFHTYPPLHFHFSLPSPQRLSFCSKYTADRESLDGPFFNIKSPNPQQHARTMMMKGCLRVSHAPRGPCIASISSIGGTLGRIISSIRKQQRSPVPRA